MPFKIEKNIISKIYIYLHTEYTVTAWNLAVGNPQKGMIDRPPSSE